MTEVEAEAVLQAEFHDQRFVVAPMHSTRDGVHWVIHAPVNNQWPPEKDVACYFHAFGATLEEAVEEMRWRVIHGVVGALAGRK